MIPFPPIKCAGSRLRGASRRVVSFGFGSRREIPQFSALKRVAPILALVAGLQSPPVGNAALISDALLDAVRFVESADGRRLVGDDGKSLGPYQLTAGAVTDSGVMNSEGAKARSRKLPVFPSSLFNYRMSEQSRAAARAYLAKLNDQLRRAIGREPTEAGLYACWNLGFAKFRSLGFRLDRCNTTVRRAAVTVELRARQQQFNALVARGQHLAATRPEGCR